MSRDPSTHVARSTGPARLSLRAWSVTCFASHVDLTSGQLCVDVWVSGWSCAKFVLAVRARSFSSSGQSLNWQSSLVCSIFCVWMSALLLSVFLFELRKLEGLPTERCSTESQALRRVAGDGKIFACGQEEVFPCWRRGTYLASWPNVALAWAFHADGQRDRDDGDRGKPT